MAVEDPVVAAVSREVDLSEVDEVVHGVDLLAVVVAAVAEAVASHADVAASAAVEEEVTERGNAKLRTQQYGKRHLPFLLRYWRKRAIIDTWVIHGVWCFEGDVGLIENFRQPTGATRASYDELMRMYIEVSDIGVANSSNEMYEMKECPSSSVACLCVHPPQDTDCLDKFDFHSQARFNIASVVVCRLSPSMWLWIVELWYLQKSWPSIVDVSSLRLMTWAVSTAEP